MKARLIIVLIVTSCACPWAGAQAGLWLPARIEVTCPAEVVITIQGNRTQSTGTLRRFASPPLPLGQVFTYELRAFRGEREVAGRQVDVEAGRTSRVTIAQEEPE